jgi:hypothetical protein
MYISMKNDLESLKCERISQMRCRIECEKISKLPSKRLRCEGMREIIYICYDLKE